jgi:hypothetical protein
MTEGIPASVPLPRPRMLSADEHALVVRLVAFAEVPSLSAQVATVRAVSTCGCGCASIGLRTDGPPVRASVVARLSGNGREDYFAVSASAGEVSVVLHVVAGFVEELEIYVGEGVATPAPHVDSLVDVEIH